jgi:hypothetical protein
VSTTAITQNNTLYRIGGGAAILGLLAALSYNAAPALFLVSPWLIAIFWFALYRLFRAEANSLGLAGVAVSVVGAVLILFTGDNPSHLYTIALLCSWFLPALIFGYLGFQSRSAGLPRLLAILGMVAGVFGVLNAIVVSIGGGDYTQPNNPALAPWIGVTYYPGALAAVIWFIWGGIVLLRKK